MLVLRYSAVDQVAFFVLMEKDDNGQIVSILSSLQTHSDGEFSQGSLLQAKIVLPSTPFKVEEMISGQLWIPGPGRALEIREKFLNYVQELNIGKRG